MESVIRMNGGRNMNMLSNTGSGTTMLHRKVAKRTEPWCGAMRITGYVGLQLQSPSYLASPPQDEEEDIPARKKPRLETPIATATAEAEAPDAQSNNHPRDTGTAHTGRWTREEDAELTSAVANTSMKKVGKEYWADVAALVTGRTNNQCHKRWQHFLDPSGSQSNNHPRATTTANSPWTPEQDADLINAVANACKTECGKELRVNWPNVAALVPGRTKLQCLGRWHNALKPSIARTAGRAGAWTEDEDNKLRYAVQMYGGKDWAAITLMVPGRTQRQCASRWHAFLNPSIALTAGRTGAWVEDEDNMLKDAVQIHGGKDWVAIAALVAGRTQKQCASRWHDFLKHSIDQATEHSAMWTTDEDSKLKDAVQIHGGRDWAAITALVMGRTQNQCLKRWHNALKDSIDQATRRSATWTKDEDNKLKNSVQMHGGKDWVAIAALVPGRTKNQCRNRWHYALHPSIALTAGRTGT
jgi:hypothetical protein